MDSINNKFDKIEIALKINLKLTENIKNKIMLQDALLELKELKKMFGEVENE